MPFGTLAVKDDPLPVFAPSYSTGLIHYSDISAIFITYRTLHANVSPLVPDVLELDDEPLITNAVVVYPMSTLGAYNEYYHLVEVKYKDQKYQYPISIILDNEAAIFLGREMYGYPKTFGVIRLEQWTGSATFLGTVEKPKGQRIVQVEFTPEKPLETTGQSSSKEISVLGLRVIPSPVEGAKPNIKELVPSSMVMKGGETWTGTGSISFPTTLGSHPMHKLEVLRIESSTYVRGASAIIYPAHTTHAL
jgi:acetoacetate decarboxylase